jgi:hypothetical protein
MSYVRPRTIYLSSENIDYFRSSDRNSVYLTDTLVPDDGYSLAYGISSIGFNATAMNISEKLGNNRLSFYLEYDSSTITHEMIKNPTFIPGIEPEWIFNPTAPNQFKPITVDIIIPDGHYTFEELLSFLSGRDPLGHPSFLIPSGYCYDLQKNQKGLENILSLIFSWKTMTSGSKTSGYQIDLLVADAKIKGIYDEGLPGTTTFYQLEQIQPKLVSVTIIPTARKPRLFEILFTNYNTSYENIPISTPTHIRAEGINPPLGICFSIKTDISPAALVGDEISPLEWLDVTDVNIKELGNEQIYDTSAGIFPDQKYNFGNYKAYYQPTLDPVYVNINISLPNVSMDEKGTKNILTRIFTLGSKEGNTSYFRAWSNPKMTLLTGLSSISNITIDLQSQDDRWDFFNLEYSIELLVVEIEDVKDDSSLTQISLPPTDAISTTSDAVGNSSYRPLPSTHFSPYRNANLQINKRTKFM